MSSLMEQKGGKMLIQRTVKHWYYLPHRHSAKKKLWWWWYKTPIEPRHVQYLLSTGSSWDTPIVGAVRRFMIGFLL